LENALYVIVR